eukprot:2163044-Amphidinium_carterae.1
MRMLIALVQQGMLARSETCVGIPICSLLRLWVWNGWFWAKPRVEDSKEAKRACYSNRCM